MQILKAQRIVVYDCYYLRDFKVGYASVLSSAILRHDTPKPFLDFRVTLSHCYHFYFPNVWNELALTPIDYFVVDCFFSFDG